MLHGRTTFSKFIIEEQRRMEKPDAALTALLNDIQTACKYIAAVVARGALLPAAQVATTTNVQGEQQKPMDVIANDIVLRTCEWGGELCGMASEELAHPYPIPAQYPRGRYLLLFDPLDGSSNVDIDVTVGTIFSILAAPEGVTEPAVGEFLQPGTRQVCAGYALYGPATMLVVTLGRGVHGFTLDPAIGAFTLPPAKRIPGSVGLAAGPEVAIMDNDGKLLAAEELGEVVIRGENVTLGYENNPKANAEAFTHGWFRTGDQGRLDAEGYLTLTGRLKEIINRGGEKISPREVDEVIMDHPAVAQVVTFGMPHPKLGEEVAAAVVLREGQALTDKALRDFLAERLADFKVPRKILFMAEIPKGATGKLQRIGLAEKLGLV